MNLLRIKNVYFEFENVLNNEEKLKLEKSIRYYLKQKKLALICIVVGYFLIFYIIGI